MISEQRKEVRSIVTQQPHGNLDILVGEQCIRVNKVKNLSQTGMRLKVERPVDINENILVRFSTRMIDLKMNGTVVWNSGFANLPEDTDKPDACYIGIKLTSRSLLASLW